MINILHLDTEGGWGGSSISLFNIVSNLDKKIFKSHVICRKEGPIINKYKKINILVERNFNLYSFSPKPHTNNLKLFITTLPQFIFFIKGIFDLLKYIKKKKIDLIHLNFEGFFFVGIFLKLFLKVPVIIHYRSTIPFDSLSHKIISIINLRFVADFVIFISNLEKKKFYKIYPFLKNIKSETIYNISECSKSKKKSNKGNDLVYIGNISYLKGVDRLIDLAQNLEKNNIRNIIKVYGDTRGEKNYKQNIVNKINELKLKNIQMMGRTNSTKRIIENAFLILRPSRHNDPWGRDVIDACHAGVPCISTGTKNDIIIDKVNSFYVTDFNTKLVTKIITNLINNKHLYKKLSNNFLKQKKNLFNRKDNIIKLQKIFINLYKNNLKNK